MPHSYTESTVKIKPSENLQLLNDMEMNNTIQSQFESTAFETTIEPESRPERCSSGSSASRDFCTSTSPIIRHREKNDISISTPRKKQKSDEIEKSFLSLSAVITDKLQNSNRQTILNRGEKNAEDKFVDLVVAELRNMSEMERKEKKRKIMDILWM